MIGRAGVWLVVGMVPASLAAQARLIGTAQGLAVQQGTATDDHSWSGTWAGVAADLKVGRVTLTARGEWGPLRGNPAHADREVRGTALAVRVQLKEWIAVGLDAEAQRQSTDLSIQVWRLVGAGATLRSSLGVAGLSAHADLTLFPYATVDAWRDISKAYRAASGIDYEFPGLPLQVGLSYRLEAVDFKDQADLRQGALIAGVTVKLFRVPGASLETP